MIRSHEISLLTALLHEYRLEILISEAFWGFQIAKYGSLRTSY